MIINNITHSGKRFFATGVILVFTLSGCGISNLEDSLDLLKGNSSSSEKDSSPPSDSDISLSSSSSVAACDISGYKTKQIGTQTWMAENLNCDIPGSKCYGEGGEVADIGGYYFTLSDAEIQANCTKYGRLYDWATALALPPSCNFTDCSGQISAKHQGICPNGWHIPNNTEWDKLINYVESSKGCTACAGKYLKTTSGWAEDYISISCNDYFGISCKGEDTYGFSALPGGIGSSAYNDFDGVGYIGLWWSSSKGISSDYSRGIHYGYDDVGYYSEDKDNLISLRCLRD